MGSKTMNKTAWEGKRLFDLHFNITVHQEECHGLVETKTVQGLGVRG